MFDNDDFSYVTVDVRRPQYDGDGRPLRTSRGKLVPDKDKNDTENIPHVHAPPRLGSARSSSANSCALHARYSQRHLFAQW